jgi:ABC-type multidrug transport system ATPase subunit
MWDVIEEAKPGRAIVLTTHSMEEVRTPLANRIWV